MIHESDLEEKTVPHPGSGGPDAVKYSGREKVVHEDMGLVWSPTISPVDIE